MKHHILRNFLLFSIVVLTGNGLIGYAVFESNQRRQEAERWVQHTMQVIYTSANILSLGKDMETASRGFVITNDSIFLKPLINAKDKIFLEISQLKELISDNPLQITNVDSLGYFVQKRLEFSFQSVEVRSKQGLSQAIALVSSREGLYFTDRMKQFVQAIEEEENRLLIQRKVTNENSVVAFNRFSALMFFLMTAFTILMLIITGKYLIQHKEKEKKAEELVLANLEVALQKIEKAKQEEANKELEAFSYSVSHDLRAPLRHINGFVDLLLKNNAVQLDAPGLRYLKIISDSTHEMGNLIDALLSFSRLSRTGLQRSMIRSNELVRQVLKTFDDEMAGREVEIIVSDLPDVMGDRELICQVWVNLISNALKYSKNKEKAVIEISGKIVNEMVVFSVKDNGAGFDMLYADKLFGVFQRLHKARDFEGIGIGLANVQRIVTRHGGVCSADGKENIGATFFFSLPASI